MRQIVQDLNSGKTILVEVPAPVVQPGHVLIRSHVSLVSLGTERMLIEFGKAGYLGKARQQPEKVKQAIQKIKTDGLRPTLEAIYRKLNEPLPLGYSIAGEVIGVGAGVKEISIGQRVVSNGSHAEIVSIPENLVAVIPDGVTYQEAAFTVVGAIGLQGIRLINPTFGETIVVIGLGLIGLITAQLLKANGCDVIGFDLDESKIDLARELGITAKNSAQLDMVADVIGHTNANGADGVIITATTKSNEVISQAAQMSRKKGRIVLVGVTGLDIKRSDFYEKELTFQVSCSYGPGRYDDHYEQKGLDYPLAYVRWTEKRNFQAILQAMKNNNLHVRPLITEVVPLNDFEKIYGNMAASKSIASLIEYDYKQEIQHVVKLDDKSFAGGKAVLGIIGAGNFTSAMILPALEKTDASIKYIASSGGLSGTLLARKFRISNSTTDYKIVLADPDVNLVLITTRHNLHARLVIEALNAGKHVFVEKPLALNREELEEVIKVYNAKPYAISVGFNRRFAPLAIKIKSLLGTNGDPINIIATMNAGAVPSGSWVHDLETGGGRIIGEACHLVDLCTFLSQSKVISVCMNAMGTNPGEQTDNASILLKYENGTNAVINYFANGSKAYSKERLEVYTQGRTLVLDNWRKLSGFGFNGFSSQASSQDKGHANLFRMLIQNLQGGGNPLIPMDEIINTTLSTFAAIESLKTGSWVNVEPVNS